MNNQNEQMCCAVCGARKQGKFCDQCKIETNNAYKRELSVSAHGHATVHYKTTHEFYEENIAWKWILIGVAIIPPIIGLFVGHSFGFILGIIFSIIGYFLAPKAIMKVREIREG